MKPVNSGGHAAYQERVLAQLRKYYPDAPNSLSPSTWEIMEKFWNLDLSEVDSIMRDRYSLFGSEPRLPSDMLRAILVSVEFGISSYTKWAADLKENHLHAIISGFLVGDTPGTATFYGFQRRLWISDKKNISVPVHPPKEKPKKPSKKGEKADPVEKVTVKELFGRFGQEPPHDMEPCRTLYEIFSTLFLKRSAANGLYMLTASDSENDLPVFPFLGPASRHDSHGFLYNWFSMKHFLPEAVVKKLLLDSAHDAMPVYTYCRDQGITPFIDLNGKGGRPPVHKEDFTINKEGVPVCREGHTMRRGGTERDKGRTKFKCPKISRTGGKISCTCDNPCSDAKYGRTVHLVMKDNPKLFNDPPRSSKEWKLEYNARTSAERCNKREKVGYKIEDGRYRSTKMWYCLLFCIMMCQHLDAWALPKTSRLRDLF